MPASGTGVSLAYVGETTRGTTPNSPSFTYLRTIGRNINLKKDTLESAEVTATRQRTDLRHGFNRVEGELGVELGLTTYNDLLLWGLGGAAWTTPTSLVGTDLSVNNTGNKFTRATGNWFTAGYRPGDWINTSGFPTAANNGQFRVTNAMTATDLPVTGGTLVTEAGDADSTVAYAGFKASIGTTLKTMTIERQFADYNDSGSDLYQVHRGCAINTMSVSMNPSGLLSAAFNIIGMSAAATNTAPLSGATYAAAATNSPFAGIDATVSVLGQSTNVSSFEFTVDNQRSLLPLLGTKFSADVFDGTAKVTGTLTQLLTGVGRLTEFENETLTQLYVRVDELGTGQFMAFSFYSAKWLANEIDPPQNGAVLMSCNFEALQREFSSGLLEVMHIQRSV